MIALAVVAGTAAVLSLGTASADPLRSTSTSLNCPLVRVIFQTETCTASVMDTDTGSATTPTGVVEFYAPSGHGFAQRARCTLSHGSCRVTYVGEGSPLGVQTISATYEGDSGHAGSSTTQDVLLTGPIGPGPLPRCRVPKVKGARLAVAKTSLKERGCSVGRVDRAFSKRFQNGRVISAKPGPGKQLRGGAKIALLVSKGKRHARP